MGKMENLKKYTRTLYPSQFPFYLDNGQNSSLNFKKEITVGNLGISELASL
jgi:hypothetical protein